MMIPVKLPEIFLTISLSTALLANAAEPPLQAASPSDIEIQQILAKRIDTEHQAIGIVVGVIDSKGRRVVSHGSLEKGDQRPLNGDTLFEIGSITKVFTALLAADMARRGEIRLDDPIAKYLAPDIKLPVRAGRQITFVDLATHTSGLPRMPENFRPKDPANPYADYTSQQMYAFLSTYELPRDIGIKFEYSNLGFGLLGQVLAHRAGMDYEQLVLARICQPLGMNSTRIALSTSLAQRFAAGHDPDLITVPAWDLPSLPGAGALRSTTNDLLTFLAAALGDTDTPLALAFKALLSTTRPTEEPFVETGLGWVVDTRGGGEIIWKNGGTGGYRTFIGFSPATRVGVVVLSNTTTETGVDDIGEHLLDSRYPLAVPAGSPKVASVDASHLDRLVGHYELAPNFILTVTREGDQLFVQGTGQPRAAVFPKSDREFLYRVVDAQITFEADNIGRTVALVLHQGGRDQRAPKIDEAEAKRLEVAVAERFKNQTAQPGTEASLRKEIDEFQRRHVNYGELAPQLSELVHQQEPKIEALIEGLGALQSVSFKGVGPGGADIYTVKFANGAVEWRILLAPDGKVSGSGFEKLP
jgi:CubicO group peptidase (beta-lactamase class C family)